MQQVCPWSCGLSRGGYDDPTWPGDDDGPLHDPAPVEDDDLGIPVGIDPEDWANMHDDEKELCRERRSECLAGDRHRQGKEPW